MLKGRSLAEHILVEVYRCNQQSRQSTLAEISAQLSPQMKLDMNTTKGKLVKAVLPYAGNLLPYADKQEVSHCINEMVQYGVLVYEVVKDVKGSNVVVFNLAPNWVAHAEKLAVSGISNGKTDLKSAGDAILSMIKKKDKPKP